jgi:hypothetical protein
MHSHAGAWHGNEEKDFYIEIAVFCDFSKSPSIVNLQMCIESQKHSGKKKRGRSCRAKTTKGEWRYAPDKGGGIQHISKF